MDFRVGDIVYVLGVHTHAYGLSGVVKHIRRPDGLGATIGVEFENPVPGGGVLGGHAKPLCGLYLNKYDLEKMEPVWKLLLKQKNGWKPKEAIKPDKIIKIEE